MDRDDLREQMVGLVVDFEVSGLDRTSYSRVLRRQDDPGANIEHFTPRLWKEHFAAAPRRPVVDR